MAKRQATPPSARRLSDDQVRERGMNPFLRPEHTKDHEPFKLTGWKRQNAEKDQIIIEVENERGAIFDLGIREGSPDHRKLWKAMGADWRSWTGGITVQIVAGKLAGTKFVNVATADRAEPF